MGYNPRDHKELDTTEVTEHASCTEKKTDVKKAT